MDTRDEKVPMTPLGAAIRVTGKMAALGLVLRYGLGYFDPGMRTWGLVGVAPLVGVVVFLHLTQRVKALAAIFVLTGVGALGFWAVLLLSGRIPVTSPAQWVVVAAILAFPLTCLVVGSQLAVEPRKRPAGVSRRARG